MIVLLFACYSEFPVSNFPPEIIALSPTDGSLINHQENVLFSVQVADPDTDPREIQIRLESSINGVFIDGSPADNGTLNKSTNELLLGEHQLILSVSDSSGNSVSQLSSIQVNALPEVSGVSIQPEAPNTLDDLEVLIAQTSDADGDGVHLDYLWYRNGVLQEGFNTSTISSELTQKDEIWSVEVFPTDDSGVGSYQRASTIIQNSVPKIQEIMIEPSEGITLGVPLSCSVSGYDSDGDSFTAAYSWKIISQGNLYDVEYASESFTPEAPLVQPEDYIRCSAQLIEDNGEVSDTVETMVMIQNRPPELQDVLIYAPSGASIRAGTTLECSVVVTDPDESELQIDYLWMNGANILDINRGLSETSVSEFTLSEYNAARGDSIVCQATVYDPHQGVVEAQSSEIIVVNTAPELLSVGISPSAPNSQDTISCLPISQDIDGDTITHNFIWTINQNVVQAGTESTLEGPFSSRDEIVCSVTVSDGQSYDPIGNSLEVGVTIQNTPPEIIDISLTPENPTVNDLVIADVTAFDLDLDPIVLSYEWFVDGVSVKTGYGNSLDGQSYFVRNQQIYVVVTPLDPEDIGFSVLSDILTVENSPPTLGEAEILPEEPIPTEEDLVCTLSSPPLDADGDVIDVLISWMHNGVPYTGGLNQTTYPNDTIPAYFTADGDEWSCTVEATDDTLSTSVTSEPIDVLCLYGYGDIPSCAANSCAEILQERPITYAEDGLYWLNPEGNNPYEAYCDMTHDGGGWTLVLKTTGSANNLYYSSIYWENEALLNSEYNYPNIDETGESSKFAAYNSVVGDTLRLEFVTPTSWNIHHYDLGICSDGSSMMQTDCEEAGECSVPSFTTQLDCEANGSCSDAAHVTETDCTDAGELWTENSWNAASWTAGLSSLSLFQGGEIMIQGDPNPETSCTGGILLQDFSDKMNFIEGDEFFGINGYKRNSGGCCAFYHTSKIRFGYASYQLNASPGGGLTNMPWRPQIGIGLFEDREVGPYGSYDLQYSAAWLDAYTSGGVGSCGLYGNGLGASATEASVNLWIR